MSGLPDTFPCPWCGMSYPAKPVLVGKAVRCKGCRNGFVLQADGVATKIQEPPPTQVTVSQVSAAAVPPSAAAVTPAVTPTVTPAPAAAPAPAVAPAPPKPPSTKFTATRPTPPSQAAMPTRAAQEDILDLTPKAPPAPAVEEVVVLAQKPNPTPPPPKSERVAKRKTEHLEAARAQMAAQLAEIQNKAAESDAAKREERKSERIAKTGMGSPSSDAKRAAREAILTGEGQRRHRELRLWWVWLGVGSAVILLLVFVLNLSSAARESLSRYAAPVESDQNRYPVLGDVLRARAWLTSARSMQGGPVLATDLSDASFGAERAIALAPLAPVLGELKGMRLDETLGMWLAPADLDKARNLTAGRSGADAAKALAAAKVRHAVHGQVVQKLALSEDDAVVVLDLLTGTSPKDGEPITKRILDLGELPDRIVVRSFRGRHGSMLVDIGRPPYRPVQGPYTGTILRFEGDRWPIGWRVLHLNQVK